MYSLDLMTADSSAIASFAPGTAGDEDTEAYAGLERVASSMSSLSMGMCTAPPQGVLVLYWNAFLLWVFIDCCWDGQHIKWNCIYRGPRLFYTSPALENCCAHALSTPLSKAGKTRRCVDAYKSFFFVFRKIQRGVTCQTAERISPARGQHASHISACPPHRRLFTCSPSRCTQCRACQAVCFPGRSGASGRTE